jgi:predicted ester cyclase
VTITNEDVIDGLFELNGKWAQWAEREKQAYIAHNGRDANLEGFREHMCKMFEEKPELKRQFLEDYCDAMWVEAGGSLE